MKVQFQCGKGSGVGIAPGSRCCNTVESLVGAGAVAGVMSALELKLTKISLCRVRSHPFCHSPRIPVPSEKLVLHRTLRQIRSIALTKSLSPFLGRSPQQARQREQSSSTCCTLFNCFQKTFWLLGKILKAAAKQQQSSSKAAAKQQQSCSKAAKQQQQQSSSTSSNSSTNTLHHL